MKNMKTKVIALVLVIPLLLIFTTGSVVQATELLVDVPVTSVTILGERNRRIDIAEEGTLKIETEVLPANATNAKVTYSAEAVEGQQKAEVIISDDGTVKPLTAGTVNIVAYADGKSDSITVAFYSSLPMGVYQYLTEVNLAVGGSTQIRSGVDYAISPDDASVTNAVWESENTDIASVSNGRITAHSAGNTAVNVTFDGIKTDGNGNVSPQTFSMRFDVTVTVDMPETGVSINGASEGTFPLNTSDKNNPQTFSFLYNSEKLSTEDINLRYDSEKFSLVEITAQTQTLSQQNYSVATLKAAFSDSMAYGESAVIVLEKDGERLATFTMVYALLTTAEMIPQSTDLVVSKNNNTFVEFTVLTNAEEMYGYDFQTGQRAQRYNVTYSSSDAQILRVQSQDNRCIATPLAEGTVTVYATVTDRSNGKVLAKTEMQFTVHNPYTQLLFELNPTNYGLQREYVLGRYNIDVSEGNNILTPVSGENALTLAVKAYTVKGETTPDFSKVKFESSNEKIATVNNLGQISLGSQSGYVTITVTNIEYGSTASAQVTIHCRANGVNVYDYDQLMAVTQGKQYETVLQNNIMLAPEIAQNTADGNFPFLAYANSCVKTTDATADDKYYENKGGKSTIKYAVEFSANVYGNGYFIDADNLTQKLFSRSGNRVFTGPTDLVSWGNNTEKIAVKSQDNAVFLVKTDNVAICNVELKGCSDASLVAQNENGTSYTDLGKLDYCGTVLEVASDNVTVSYSRLSNGRTVLRIFGKASASLADVQSNPQSFKAEVTVNNCLLGYAREFILKMGTNQINRVSPSNYTDFGITYLNKISGTISQEVYDEASPFFTKANGENYLPKDADNATDDYFNNNYVLTDVTLEDCAFRNAGLFSVGLESMFGGLCLHRYDYNSNYAFCSKLNWGGIAGASYPAALHLKGDVRFYDWKQVDSVNSDTLLEGSDTEVAQRIGLNLDFSELIGNYDAQLQQSEKLMQDYNGQKYVNGAIAFYGGGKNYSYVDTSEVSGEFHSLANYTVPVTYFIAQGNARLIYYTAGQEDFRFMLYNSASSFNVQKQFNDFASGQALNWLYRTV